MQRNLKFQTCYYAENKAKCFEDFEKNYAVLEVYYAKLRYFTMQETVKVGV